MAKKDALIYKYFSSFQIPYKKVDRRAGDVASVYGNADLAKQELGWSASRDLKQMCKYDRD